MYTCWNHCFSSLLEDPLITLSSKALAECLQGGGVCIYRGHPLGVSLLQLRLKVEGLDTFRAANAGGCCGIWLLGNWETLKATALLLRLHCLEMAKECQCLLVLAGLPWVMSFDIIKSNDSFSQSLCTHNLKIPHCSSLQVQFQRATPKEIKYIDLALNCPTFSSSFRPLRNRGFMDWTFTFWWFCQKMFAKVQTIRRTRPSSRTEGLGANGQQ